jgi:thiosulfate dehydrogenase [quinone] large subunit
MAIICLIWIVCYYRIGIKAKQMDTTQYTKSQSWSLIFLRVFIGWHFLYEGIIKLYNPSWTSKGYLYSSQGPLKDVFTWLAGDSMIVAVDMLNILALTSVGLLLILGLYTRLSSLAGIGLLLLYYLSHPAFPWLPQGPAEGSYWLINKNLIEMIALFVLYHFPTSQIFGLHYFLKKRAEVSNTTSQPLQS